MFKLKHALNQGRVYKNKYPTNIYEIEFSIQEKNELLDEVSNLIMSVGFNQDDKINKSGLLIEDIIDILQKT